MGIIKSKKEPDDAVHPSLPNCDGLANTGSLDVKNYTSLLVCATNLIKSFIKLIEVSITFLEGDIKIILIDRGDGTRVCSFEKKDYCLETAEKEPKKKKSWKDHPNATKLQAMIDDGLLETYNTEDVEGLKIAKTFTDAKFLEYESAFGSIKGFVALADEGLLYSVSGQKLLYSTMIEYRNKHKK